MINDIYATSMHGRYETVQGGTTLEQGQWSYRGYGNAEITLVAEGERPELGLRFDVRMHSAERQVNEIYFKAVRDGATEREFTAVIGGSMVTLHQGGSEAEPADGSVLTAPSETIYVGPSPIWMIHLLMVNLPPEDREVTTPVFGFCLEDEEFRGGFFRVRRSGLQVQVEVLDREGEVRQTMQVALADDGCPTMIRDGEGSTEIVRLPS